MTDALAAVDLFDKGADPFSPVMLAQKPQYADGANWALDITVIGTPRPQGSKKAFVNKKTGRAIIVNDNDARLRTWRQDVVTATTTVLKAERRTALAPRTAIDVAITFMMPRPTGHWRTGRNAHLLRDDAPARPSTKPDIDKLIRGTLDALRDAGAYIDDAQVVGLNVRKVWATEQIGAVIRMVTA